MRVSGKNAGRETAEKKTPENLRKQLILFFKIYFFIYFELIYKKIVAKSVDKNGITRYNFSVKKSETFELIVSDGSRTRGRAYDPGGAL